MPFIRDSLKYVGAATSLLVVLSGCGYEIVKEKGIFGGEVATLAVPVFKNATFEPHASLYVSDSFTRELLATGLFQLNKANTDGYLEGTIKNIRILPATTDANGIVTEKVIYLDVELRLFRKNGTFMKSWTVSDSEVYRTNDVNIEEYNKKDALQRMSARMARKYTASILADY